jgi:hypothetical protein
LQKFATKDLKIYIVDLGGGGGVGAKNQLVNFKISLNCASFISTKVKCIVTLFLKNK